MRQYIFARNLFTFMHCIAFKFILYSEECIFQTSCQQVSDLVDSLQNIISLQSTDHNKCLPKYLVCHLRQTITGLARIPFVNSYVRIPPIVWKFGWQPTMEGAYHTELPPLPVDILKEKDVLKEFVYRVNQVGKRTTCGCCYFYYDDHYYTILLYKQLVYK